MQKVGVLYFLNQSRKIKSASSHLKLTQLARNTDISIHEIHNLK